MSGRDGIPPACRVAGQARGLGTHQRIGAPSGRGPPTRKSAKTRRGSRRAHPTGGGAQRRRGIADEVVEAERGGQPLTRAGARHRDLLEGQERPGLARADREVADHGRGHDSHGLARSRKTRAETTMRRGLATEERRTRAPSARRAGGREGHGRAREQGQRHRHAGLPGIEARARPGRRGRGPRGAVAERARRLGDEDEPGVTAHARSARQ